MVQAAAGRKIGNGVGRILLVSRAAVPLAQLLKEEHPFPKFDLFQNAHVSCPKRNAACAWQSAMRCAFIANAGLIPCLGSHDHRLGIWITSHPKRRKNVNILHF
jgi:hypothetical protein